MHEPNEPRKILKREERVKRRRGSGRGRGREQEGGQEKAGRVLRPLHHSISPHEVHTTPIDVCAAFVRLLGTGGNHTPAVTYGTVGFVQHCIYSGLVCTHTHNRYSVSGYGCGVQNADPRVTHEQPYLYSKEI